MRINYNGPAMAALRHATRADARLSRSYQRLCSGLRINRAADDAAGLAVVTGMRTRLGAGTVGLKAVSDGISLVNTAEGALGEIGQALSRMRELTMSYLTDTLGPDDRAHAVREYEELVASVEQIARTTAFNGRPLLDGTFDGSIQIGPQAGPLDRVTITMPDVVNSLAYFATYARAWIGSGSVEIRHAEPGDGGNGIRVDVVEGCGENVGMSAVFSSDTRILTVTLGTGDDCKLDPGKNSALQVAAAIDRLSEFSARTRLLGDDPLSQEESVLLRGGREIGSLDDLDASIAWVGSERAQLGAIHNMLDRAGQRLAAGMENLAMAESRIRDADMAFELMSFARRRILHETAIAMLAHSNAAPRMLLELLA